MAKENRTAHACDGGEVPCDASAGGQHLAGAGRYEITGLAWSGRARVAAWSLSKWRKNWQKAELSRPVLKKMRAVRFRLRGMGFLCNEAVIGSR